MAFVSLVLDGPDQCGTAVPGRFRVVGHFRCHALRNFRARRILRVRYLDRVHIDRTLRRDDRVLGRHRCCGRGRSTERHLTLHLTIRS
jgi:hypothetical protein